jgi:phosphate transport system permease protein
MTEGSNFIYLRRRLINYSAMTLACVAMIAGLSFLLMILWTLLAKGFPAMTWKTLSESTPPPGDNGGLLNAIYGSVMLTAIGTLIGTPIGILAGTYLSEYSKRKGGFGSAIRFINSILLSTPSVVVGFFIYAFVVSRVGHFSALAGTLSLAMILIPIVTNSTENMLKLVPHSLREASAALGAPKWRTTVMVTYPSAKAGILTGVLLGIARISGESAPLLFTALNNQFWSTDLTKPMANLPVTIFQFAMSPYDDWQRLAWGGALLITFGVLFLNILARLLVRRNAVR